MFARSGSGWTQQGSKLTASDESSVGQGLFGWSVALSADGSTALIGGDGDNNSAGAAWVFAAIGRHVVAQGSKLTPSDETGAGQFGGSVALSGDGGTALIGARR